MHAANRGCKNYPCSIALRADWKINRYHLAHLVSSNRDWFAYYRHTTPIFTHSLYVYAGETIMPPRVLASGPKPCEGKEKRKHWLPSIFIDTETWIIASRNCMGNAIGPQLLRLQNCTSFKRNIVHEFTRHVLCERFLIRPWFRHGSSLQTWLV